MKVLIIDDHPIVHAGLRRLIGSSQTQRSAKW